MVGVEKSVVRGMAKATHGLSVDDLARRASHNPDKLSHISDISAGLCHVSHHFSTRLRMACSSSSLAEATHSKIPSGLTAWMNPSSSDLSRSTTTDLPDA